jgi:hypothetical protein
MAQRGTAHSFMAGGFARRSDFKFSISDSLLVVVEQAEDVVVFEAVAAFEEVEFDGEGEAGDLAAQLLDELYRCFHGAAGGEEIVDEDDALAGLDGIHMDLEGVGTVLEVVGDSGHWGGKLARLAHRNEAGIEAVREGGAEDESARLDAQHEVDFLLDVVGGQSVNELGEAGLVFEQGGDVVEENAGLGEVGHGAHEGLEFFYVDWLDFGHTSIIKAGSR